MTTQPTNPNDVLLPHISEQHIEELLTLLEQLEQAAAQGLDNTTYYKNLEDEYNRLWKLARNWHVKNLSH